METLLVIDLNSGTLVYKKSRVDSNNFINNASLFYAMYNYSSSNFKVTSVVEFGKKTLYFNSSSSLLFVLVIITSFFKDNTIITLLDKISSEFTVGVKSPRSAGIKTFLVSNALDYNDTVWIYKTESIVKKKSIFCCCNNVISPDATTCVSLNNNTEIDKLVQNYQSKNSIVIKSDYVIFKISNAIIVYKTKSYMTQALNVYVLLCAFKKSL